MVKHGDSGKTQRILNFPGSQGLGPTSCKLCGMAYHAYVEQDRRLHEKHHAAFVNGIKWGVKSEKLNNIGDSAKRNDVTIEVVKADVSQSSHVTRVEKLLLFVNLELKAPPANDAWKSNAEGSVRGMAFVAVIRGIAVGLCVTEPLLDAESQGRWMVFLTQEIVPKQVNKEIILGISRIWVAPKWRRAGLGKLLLKAVCKHLVHGIILKPRQVAFSQPSSAGSLLARDFNAVKHKSGELLLPVYIES